MSGWKKILGSIAPTLATALGGPMAGTAVKFLSNKFLGTEEGTEQDIAQAISMASPEQLAELKKIDADFKVQMEKIGVDVFALEIEDRKDARSMAKVNMWPQIILSVIFIGGYFAIVGLLVTGEIVVPAEQMQIVSILIGVLTAGVANIMQFWFGSSHGSKNKDKAK